VPLVGLLGPARLAVMPPFFSGHDPLTQLQVASQQGKGSGRITPAERTGQGTSALHPNQRDFAPRPRSEVVARWRGQLLDPVSQSIYSVSGPSPEDVAHTLQYLRAESARHAEAAERQAASAERQEQWDRQYFGTWTAAAAREERAARKQARLEALRGIGEMRQRARQGQVVPQAAPRPAPQRRVRTGPSVTANLYAAKGHTVREVT
jgi:hypothetical protein